MEPTTRRESLEAAFDTVLSEEPEPNVKESVEQSEAERPGRTAGRARDDQGRLLPGKAQKEQEQAREKTQEKTQERTQERSVQQQAEVKPRPQRPSTWKKEYWPHWDGLDPNLAEYIVSREQDYAKGVSTYKAEADRAKELFEAFNPYQGMLQQYGLTPTQAITRLMQAEYTLRNSTPQERLQHFAKLANDYGVPMEMLQGGQQNPQLMALYQGQEQLRRQMENERVAREMERQELANQEVAGFLSSEKFPHAGQVKERMAGLLQAGLAQDLESAYDMAVRLDPELFDSIQEQKRAGEEQARREEEARRVASARAKNVQTRTSTPAGAGAVERKGRRAELEDAFDQHAG